MKIKVSRSLPQNTSESKTEMANVRYMSPKIRKQIINDLRLI